MFVYKGVHGQSMRVKDVIAVLHDTLLKTHDTLLKTLVERAVAQACILNVLSTATGSWQIKCTRTLNVLGH